MLPSSDSSDEDKESLPSYDDMINSETRVTEVQTHPPASEPFLRYSTSVDREVNADCELDDMVTKTDCESVYPQ